MSDLEFIKAQRNVFMGKYRSMASLMETARSQIRQVSDHTQNEGDRVYFGSTNHADWLKDLAEDMEGWMIDFYLPKGDINKMERDPYKEIRQQRSRAEVAEAGNEMLRLALTGLLNHYVEMVNSGDCGSWDPESDQPVKDARAALDHLFGAEAKP